MSALSVEVCKLVLQACGVSTPLRDGDVRVTKFTGGQSNPTYKIEAASALPVPLVLRKQPSGRLLPSAHRVDREYRVLRALSATDVPVPRALFFEADGSRFGVDTAFYVMEFVDGELHREPSLDDINDASRRHRMYASFIDTLAALHTVDVDAVGLGDYGGSGGGTESYFVRQTKRWTEQYRRSIAGTDKLQPIEAMEKLAAWLGEPSNVPSADDAPVLTHGDYRLENVLFDRHGSSSVVAVLDWELSTLGDRWADVAYATMPYYVDSLMGVDGLSSSKYDERVSGIPSLYSFLQRYCYKCARALPQQWRSYVALALFRVAGILIGVKRRAVDGNASDERASIVGEFAETMASAGLRVVQTPMGDDLLSLTLLPSSTSWIPSLVFATYPFVSSTRALCDRVQKFIVRHRLADVEKELLERFEALTREQRWTTTATTLVDATLRPLQAAAIDEGLWCLFERLPALDYALVCELTGRVGFLAPAAFNCAAPDSGNMEVLAKFGSAEQRAKYLEPLRQGTIRSAFLMTEPGVASSDPTALMCAARRDGTDYVVSGRKWWATGAGSPKCAVFLVVCRTAPADDTALLPHQRHSIVAVPRDAAGVRLVRALEVSGYDDAEHGGHWEVEFVNVRVPSTNLIGGEGQAFAIGQSRLGGGRLHHCARAVGMAERALTELCARASDRGLLRHGIVRHRIGLCRFAIEEARASVLRAARAVDLCSALSREARALGHAMKATVPRAMLLVVDEAQQIHGAEGVSQLTMLARYAAGLRTLRIADGADDVHVAAAARIESLAQQHRRNASKSKL